jgi:CheY-like chemotaxis protein
MNDRKHLDLAVILAVAAARFESRLDAARHKLTVSLPSESMALVGYATLLAEVLTSLLDDAVDRIDYAGEVWLTAHRLGDRAVVSIKGTGRAGSREEIESVTAAVEEALALHGGRIEARQPGSTPTTEFVIHLPLAPPGTLTFATNGHRGGLATRRILVVDDNRDGADSLGLMLQMLGAEASVVYDGRAALRELAAFQPQVVLLDLEMPEMNGYEVARAVRGDEAFGNTLLIALTGWSEAEDRRRTADAGFDHHLVKPLELETLQTAVTSLEALQEFRFKPSLRGSGYLEHLPR